MRYVTVLLIVVSIMAFSLFGCIPHSDHPLTKPGAQQIDASIFGTWFWRDNNDSGYIHIGVDDKTKLLRLMMVGLESDGEMEVLELTGHTTALKGNTYLNLKWVRPADEVSGYIFVKYDVKDGFLGISFMDSDVVEKAIKNKALNGAIEEGELLPSIHITDAGVKLQRFFLDNDKALFVDTKYLPGLTLPENAMKSD